jgi:uncharacterized membrane protein
MAIAAKKLSQVVTHMVIGFGIAYALTGSIMFGGLAVLLEPVINVLLLPLHEKTWAVIGRRAATDRQRYLAIGAERISQTGLHMGVAFGVMYWASGSAAFGGLAAVLEPVCNVILMPLHDRAWERARQAIQRQAIQRKFDGLAATSGVVKAAARTSVRFRPLALAR